MNIFLTITFSLLLVFATAEEIRTPEEIQYLAIGLSENPRKPIIDVDEKILRIATEVFRKRKSQALHDNEVAPAIEKIMRIAEEVTAHFNRYKELEPELWNDFIEKSELLQAHVRFICEATLHLLDLYIKGYENTCLDEFGKKVVTNIYDTFVNAEIMSYVIHSQEYRMYERETSYEIPEHERFIRFGYWEDVLNVNRKINQLLAITCQENVEREEN